MPSPQPRSAGPRRRRERPAAALIVAYLLAALLAAAVPHLVGLRRWVALHLLFLGAATNAIVVYSAHFAETLLHARPLGARWRRTQLAVLNAGVLGVLTGVATRQPTLVVTGAVLVAAAVLAGAARLVRLLRTSLAGRLRPTVWFYVLAAGFLAAGAVSGAVLGTRGARLAGSGGYLVLLHAHANLFGWVGLSVLGTMVMLAPAALRTRMSPAAPRVARWTLVACGAGLGVAVAGLLARRPLLAAAGMIGYAGGVTVSLGPLLAAIRRHHPRDMAGASLVAALGWLLGAAVYDAVGLATGGAGWDRLADRLATLLAVGLVAQVLVGALSFLLPVLLGGGPVGGKRMSLALNWAWAPRLAITNVGGLLAVLPAGGAVRPAGGALALVGLGSFLPVAGLALRTLPFDDRSHLGRPGARQRIGPPGAQAPGAGGE